MDLTTGNGPCVHWGLARGGVLGSAGSSNLLRDVRRGNILLTGGWDPSVQGSPVFVSVIP